MTTLRTETTGLRPAFEHREERTYRARKSPNTDSAYHRLRVNPAHVRRVFHLSWPEANRGQYDEVLFYYGLSNQGIKTLTYTPVGEVDADAIEVHMHAPKIDMLSINHYDIRVTLEAD